jgi:predicted mannosyl-3-phosphoglycerate phosphatase (HAD superfamily)
VHQVPSFEEFEQLRKKVQELRAELAQYRATLPEWVREAEAQQLTGLSQATLARERKKPDTLLVWKSTGGLRYLRSSLLAFNEARTIRRQC